MIKFNKYYINFKFLVVEKVVENENDNLLSYNLKNLKISKPIMVLYLLFLFPFLLNHLHISMENHNFLIMHRYLPFYKRYLLI